MLNNSTVEFDTKEDVEIVDHNLKKAFSYYYNNRFTKAFKGLPLYQGIFVLLKSEKKRYLMLDENFINKIHLLNNTTFEWSISVKSITQVKLIKSDECSLKICINSSLNKKLINESKLTLKNKDEFPFTFKYKKDKEELLFLLRKLKFLHDESLLKVTN